MRRILPWVQLLALMAVIFLCITLGLAALTLRHTAADLDVAALKIARSVEMVQQHADRVLTEAGLTAKQTRLAAEEQRKYWNKEVPELTARTERVLDATQSLLEDLRVTSAQVRSNSGQITEDASASLRQVPALLSDVDSTLQHLDRQVSNPAISESLQHIEVATGELAKTSQSVAVTASDVQEKVHSWTHPKPLVQVADWTLKVARTLGSFFRF